MAPSPISCTLFAVLSCAASACGQDLTARPAPAPATTNDSAASSITQLAVPSGTPLQVVLDKEVRIRKAGQILHGRIVAPVYAFDKLVIPVGSQVTGQISKIDGVSAGKRTLAILNVNFTPDHPIEVEFHQLTLPDGTHIPLNTRVKPGSGQVIRLSSAGDHDKKNAVKGAASQKIEQARQEWRNAMKQVQEPGKVHRAVQYGVAQLPVHPQYIKAGTLYFAELETPLDFGSETVSAATASTIGTAPPAGSLAHALLETPLNSATSQKGSEVNAVFSRPLFDQDRLIVPQGSRLRGSVLQVRPARFWHRNGQLRIGFHELVFPDGTVQRVDATLGGVQAGESSHVRVDSEGGAQASSPKSRYISTATSVGLALIGSGGKNDVGEAGPVAGGATAFKLVGITVGLLARSHTWGILMSAYGGGRSIYSNFIGRGRNLVFPTNTAMEIGFGDRTTLPMPVAH